MNELAKLQDAFLLDEITHLKTYVKTAYAPYSRFQVACSLITNKRQIIRSVNMENASYGLSMCAERNAIAKAVSEKVDLKEVVTLIIYHRKEVVACCGACAQVISEMLDQECDVIMCNEHEYIKTKVKCLLPFKFSKEDLK
ncbi:MAG: cytidine deaminase [Erysipelotrichia bacterium]|nr:cytidine deaminase [Erysipelotrichia bacterium]NCC54367.1 cytidine deaminase [Erysipelotrichia bacterium]